MSDFDRGTHGSRDNWKRAGKQGCRAIENNAAGNSFPLNSSAFAQRIVITDDSWMEGPK